jgi:hypothetical protein
VPGENLHERWSIWPDAGVGIACGLNGLVAVDIDTDDPDMVAAIMKVLPQSPVAKRGKRGRTLFYRGADKVKTTSFKFGPDDKHGLDVLAHGRQTILPPSVHADTGKPYQWLSDDTLVDTPPESLPELPGDTIERLTKTLAQFGYEPPIEREAADPSAIDETCPWRGVKAMALADFAPWVPGLGLPKTRRIGANQYEAVAAWRDVENTNLKFHGHGIRDFGSANEGHSPINVVMLAMGLTDSEALTWLSNKVGYVAPVDPYDQAPMIANAEAKRAGSVVQGEAAAECAGEPANDDEAPAEPWFSSSSAPDPNPFDLAALPGLLGSTARWVYSVSWLPQAEFAVLSAIAIGGVLFGRRFVTPTGLGVNLYLVGIAPAGGGKDDPLTSAQELLAECDLMHLVGHGDVTSDGAIETELRHRPCHLMAMDEIGIFLQGVTSARASTHEKKVRNVLLDVYSKSKFGKFWTGKGYSDPSGKLARKDPIYNPTLTVFGVSVAESFYAGMSAENITDGVFGRMTVVSATTPAVAGHHQGWHL